MEATFKHKTAGDKLIVYIIYTVFLLLGIFVNPIFFYGITILISLMFFCITFIYFLMYITRHKKIIKSYSIPEPRHSVRFYIQVGENLFMALFMYQMDFKITGLLFLIVMIISFNMMSLLQQIRKYNENQTN